MNQYRKELSEVFGGAVRTQAEADAVKLMIDEVAPERGIMKDPYDEDNKDPFRGVKGIITGVILSAPLWYGLYLLVRWLWKMWN